MIKTTSRNALAALEESGMAGTQRALILKHMVKRNKKSGYTRAELEHYLNMRISSVCGRVRELLDKKLIRVDGEKVCPITAKYVEALKIVI